MDVLALCDVELNNSAAECHLCAGRNCYCRNCSFFRSFLCCCFFACLRILNIVYDLSCERCQGVGYFLKSSTEALSDSQASVQFQKSCIYQVRENSRVFKVVFQVSA